MDEYFNAYTYASGVLVLAKTYGIRMGQALFNSLPVPIGDRLVGLLEDPYYFNMTKEGVVDWIDNHLIFDGPDVIAFFIGNEILWEKSC